MKFMSGVLAESLDILIDFYNKIADFRYSLLNWDTTFSMYRSDFYF